MDTGGRRPVMERSRRLVSRSLTGTNGQYREVLRADPEQLYRTAVCSSGNNGPVSWRLTHVADGGDKLYQHATSGPGQPCYFSIPPEGGLIEARLTSDADSSGVDPFTFEETTGDGDVQVVLVESDGLLDQGLPPILCYAGDGQVFTVGAKAITIPVPSGYYTVDRGVVRRMDAGGGTISGFQLSDVSGVYHIGDGTVAQFADVLDLTPGTPLAVKDSLTLDFTVATASVTLDIALYLRRDQREYLLDLDNYVGGT